MAAGERLVTGQTRVIFMIGSPIAQARSPYLFNTYFADHGADRIMVPVDVGARALPGFVEMIREASNCDGFVSTIPNKGSLLDLVDDASPTAKALASVNVVKRGADGRLSGDMADGAGFWNGVSRAGFEVRGSSVVLAGAGAAGIAIAHEFAERGGRRLAVWSREHREIEALIAVLAGKGLAVEPGIPLSLDGFSMAINATPVGMAYAPGSVFPRELLATLRRGSFAADAITEPVETQFLRDAAAIGLHTVNGRAMTFGQFERLREFLGV